MFCGTEKITWRKQQLDDREYEEVPNDPNVLINTIMKASEKIRLRGDLCSDVVNYFPVKIPNMLDSIFYQKFINAYLQDALGIPVISNCGFYTENISLVLDYHLQPYKIR